MIALGEDPGIEVGRHIISDVHLGPVLVVFHLLVRDAHALLECDGILVVAGLDVLCDATVCPVSTNDNVDFKRLLLTLARIALILGVLVEGEDVGLVLLLRDGHAHEETVDQRGTVLLGPLSEEVIKNLAADHPDELVVLERLTDLDFLVGRRDHGHLSDLTIHNVLGKAELVDHAERDRATARLAVIQLSLDKVSLDSLLGQGIRCTGTRGASANHSHSELATLGERRARANNHLGIRQRARLGHLGSAAALGQGRPVLSPLSCRGHGSQSGHAGHGGAGGGRGGRRCWQGLRCSPQGVDPLHRASRAGRWQRDEGGHGD
mmetsp:Transcript_140128/g.198601  ORF Transcript_140128/g.198601 Transcript_140128/m.198601 type:complete len:321 (-) Transcript_140128:57-1019(-)